MMDKETFMHRKGEILHEARMNGNDTFDGLAGSIAYWQDVANYAHEKRVLEGVTKTEIVPFNGRPRMSFECFVKHCTWPDTNEPCGHPLPATTDGGA